MPPIWRFSIRYLPCETTPAILVENLTGDNSRNRAAHLALSFQQCSAQLLRPCGIQMAEIASFFLNDDTRAKRGIVFQTVPAFEKQDSKVIVFLQHNRVNSQLLDLGAKFMQPGLYFAGSLMEVPVVKEVRKQVLKLAPEQEPA